MLHYIAWTAHCSREDRWTFVCSDEGQRKPYVVKVAQGNVTSKGDLLLDVFSYAFYMQIRLFIVFSYIYIYIYYLWSTPISCSQVLWSPHLSVSSLSSAFLSFTWTVWADDSVDVRQLAHFLAHALNINHWVSKGLHACTFHHFSLSLMPVLLSSRTF